MFSKTIRILIWLCFMMSMAATLYAQTITGTVTNAQSGDPLADANVIQMGTSNGVSVEVDGTFSLKLLEEASTKILVTFVGYQNQTIDTDGKSMPLNIQMMPKTIISNEVFVEALRVDEASPIAYENVGRTEIEEKNLGQDMPYMISHTPSVTTSSDAGAGVGYTGMRIRGVDQGRINVTINGIPLNDAESHGVFWVDLPDLASSVENIQIQRGVGSSTNGAPAFGATMNIQTSQMAPEAYGEVNLGMGSFNTRKANVKLGSGLMKNGWQLEGRLSKIESNGYIDRAQSDLKSFYLSAAKHGDRSLLRADVFSGFEKTYQAWYGVPENRLKSGDRRYNPAGAYTDENGDTQFYDDQTDNYQQDHYQLHYSYQITDNWDASASLHYTYGRGHYEEFQESQELTEYGIVPIQLPDTTISESDLVRQLWLDNHFYGTVFSTKYNHANQWSITFGGGYNEYDGDHFGEVVWARYAGESETDQQYYFNNGFKTDFNTYVKVKYNITDKLIVFADAQIRYISYDFQGKGRQKEQGGSQEVIGVQQSDRLTFFNPKGGITYHLKDNQRIYASFSVAHKEPTRKEYVGSAPGNQPQHESLYDWEAGYRGRFDQFTVGANLYYMDYKNQLILTGEVNDVGATIRQNVPESYRAGIELQAGVQISPTLQWSGNATLSRNKIEEYTFYLDNYDTGGQEARVYKDTDISFSAGFIGNSQLRYNYREFSAELSTKYVSRQYLDNTQTYSRSLDPYLVNDLRLGYGWEQALMFKSIKAALLINNLFNEMYESNGYTFGGISDGEPQFFNYYYPQAGRNFLLQLSFTF